jgi:hypothetical protein
MYFFFFYVNDRLGRPGTGWTHFGLNQALLLFCLILLMNLQLEQTNKLFYRLFRSSWSVAGRAKLPLRSPGSSGTVSFPGLSRKKSDPLVIERNKIYPAPYQYQYQY